MSTTVAAVVVDARVTLEAALATYYPGLADTLMPADRTKILNIWTSLRRSGFPKAASESEARVRDTVCIWLDQEMRSALDRVDYLNQYHVDDDDDDAGGA